MQNNHHLRWNAFNSLLNEKLVIEELNTKRNNYIMPALTDEQMIELGKKINQAFLQEKHIKISYCNKNKLTHICGTIKKVDLINQLIKINNQFICFERIVNIDEIMLENQ